MTNHPNRSRGDSPAKKPTSEQVRAARIAAGLTQKNAALFVYCTTRAWEYWEAGQKQMHPATFELFLLKTRQKTLEDII